MTLDTSSVQELLGVSGLTTDTLVLATRPRLIRPRPVFKWHSTAPTALPSSTRAIWKLFLLPPRCCLWLFFQLSPIMPSRPCSGSDLQIPCCPPLLAFTWSSICSSNNPPPVLGISPSFSLEPPSSPPRALLAPTRSVVLWPQRPR